VSDSHIHAQKLTPLHTAVKYAVDHDKAALVILLLLERGAALEAKTFKGQTALHLAVQIRDDNVRQYILILLLQAGSDINAKDDKGFTPLHFASSHWGSNPLTWSSLKSLIGRGADIEATSTDKEPQKTRLGVRDYGLTPFQLAIRKNRISTAILLRRHGAEMVFEPRFPEGPLHGNKVK
jgi:ankyrin repeat protein